MPIHPTSERLTSLGLAGRVKALDEQRHVPTTFDSFGFEERPGLLLDREAAERDAKRLTTRLRFGALRQAACVEDPDLHAPRGIDRAVMAHPIDGAWTLRHENLLITGPAGLGKSWIACALGHEACRDGRRVAYHRVPKLFDALVIARDDGRHARMSEGLARTDLLILDDWGLAVLTAPERRDLPEIPEDRHGRGSTIVTSQLPVEHWHEAIGDPTLADAILDRLVHDAHRSPPAGESMRKRAAAVKPLDPKRRARPHATLGQTARGMEWLPTMPWNRCPPSVEYAAGQWTGPTTAAGAARSAGPGASPLALRERAWRPPPGSAGTGGSSSGPSRGSASPDAGHPIRPARGHPHGLHQARHRHHPHEPDQTVPSGAPRCD